MDVAPYLPIALFGLVASFILYSVVKNRGFRGMVFGAPVKRKMGEIIGHRWFLNSKLRIYELDDRQDERAIGVELAFTTFGSWQMTGMALSLQQAEELVGFLNDAIKEKKMYAR